MVSNFRSPARWRARFFTCVWLSGGAISMIGRADEASDALQRALHGNDFIREEIDPGPYRWTRDGEHLWHRRNIDARHHMFVFIEAKTGRESPAFDPAKLTPALIQATGNKTLNPDDLPLSFLDYCDAHTIRFYAEGKTWECNLANYDLHSVQNQDVADLFDHPENSERSGPSMPLEAVNQTNTKVALDWIDPEGARHHYANLAPGGHLTEQTYVGDFWAAYDEGDHFIVGTHCPAFPALFEIKPPKVDSNPLKNLDPSPDGKWGALLKNNNVWLHSQSGDDFALSTDGTADDSYEEPLVWSPDSKHLAVFRATTVHDRQVTLIESSPKDQLQPKTVMLDYPKAGDPYPKRNLTIFDLAAKTGKTVPNTLFADPMELTDLRWRTPDEVTYMDDERGYQHKRLLGATPEGTCRVIIDEASPQGLDTDTYIDYLDQTQELLRLTELQDGWNHLYLYDYATGRVKNCVTPGAGYVDHIESVDEEKRQVLFWACGMESGEDPYLLHLYRVGFDGKGLENLTPGNFTHTARFSPTGEYLLDFGSRIDAAPVITLRSALHGEKIAELAQVDLAPLLATGWRLPEPFVAKGRDGNTDIYGVIWRPSNFDPKRKYPVIENVYAGPQGVYVPKSFEINNDNQRLAQAGFIVVEVDGMGTGHRSRSFEAATYRNLGDAGFPDRMAWIRAAAQKHPEMDLTRVGIFGTSAGGQNALRGILMWPDFYKACVADCGCHDNRMDKRWWNERFMGLPVGPWYEEQSNVTQAYRLQGKLLLLVGEMDKNVDPSSTLQVVNALIKADKQFDFLVMPEQGHGVLGTDYGWEKMVRFFMHHLLNIDPK
jgi:dipeptidyl-peptidase-4